MARTQDDLSAVQRVEAGRRRRFFIVVAVIVVIAAIGLYVAGRFSPANRPVTYLNDEDHFRFGSIGSEPDSGLPYYVWKALPALYPEVFHGGDFSVFGFLYGTEPNGERRDLPIGISRRTVRGIDLAWMNCAICHTGTVRDSADGAPRVVLGMPSNNLDLRRFVAFVLGLAGDKRLEADQLIPAMEKAGAKFDWIDRLTWRYIVIPRLQTALAERSQALGPLLAMQPLWGPGRVDTFNPYKVMQFHIPVALLTPQEKIGTADFPSIFNQGPREGMNLHWDGNNDSLAERNLSAALGAGVTEQSVDHPGIERVANWLLDLHPPPSPNHPDAARVAAGRTLYMAQCAACHGYQDSAGYVFQGAYLGRVEPNSKLGTDPARLDSYTEQFRDMQLDLFASEPAYHFTHFKKTDGYANLPLDGLWLRAPYLHNGSVPTLADLLLAPADRPKAFVRGLDIIDPEKGGFQAPPCTPGQQPEHGFCYDTGATGNGNGGHVYGIDLGAEDKAALLAYLLTF